MDQDDPEMRIAELERQQAEQKRMAELERQQADTRAVPQQPQPGPPAAWYPDPSGSGKLRYFDGSVWTDSYSDPSAAQPTGSQRPARMSMRTWLRLAMFAVVGSLILAGAISGLYERSNPFHEPELTYANHVGDSTKVRTSCGRSTSDDECFSEAKVKSWGRRICSDLRGGATGVEEIATASADPVVGRANAEITVYWAITDLCSDQMSKRQDQWKNGH